jgi:hypothetical protein
MWSGERNRREPDKRGGTREEEKGGLRKRKEREKRRGRAASQDGKAHRAGGVLKTNYPHPKNMYTPHMGEEEGAEKEEKREKRKENKARPSNHGHSCFFLLFQYS